MMKTKTKLKLKITGKLKLKINQNENHTAVMQLMKTITGPNILLMPH